MSERETYTVAEARQMVGKPIARIVGRLTKIYDLKTGEGEYGAWSLQNGILEDETGSISILFSKCQNMSESLGDEITIRASQGKRGLTGILVETKEYKGQTTIQLKVTASAIILKGDAPDDAPIPSKPQQNAPQANVATPVGLKEADVERLILKALEPAIAKVLTKWGIEPKQPSRAMGESDIPF